MQIELIGKCVDEKDVEGIRKIVSELAINSQMKVIEFEEMMILEVCPLGKITFSSEEQLFSLDANSDFAGAGFHDFVIHFYETLQQKVDTMVEVQIIDPSGYDIHKNFIRLQNEYKLWMKKLVDSIENMHNLSWLAFGLSDQGYLPKQIEGYVNTHMHRKSFDYFKQDLDMICDELFIWNEKGKNAKYYRNCAYYLLYVEHYDDYYSMNEESLQCANDILSYLESAYELDDSVALPLDHYDELCMLLNRKKGLDEAIHDDLTIVGYRSEAVYYPINRFYVLNDGHCETSYDHTSDSYYFMAPYKSISEEWKYMYIYTVNPSRNALKTFSEHKLLKLEHENLDIKYYIENQEQIHLYSMVKNKKQNLFVHVVLKEEAMIEEALNLLKQTKYYESE